ncbi:MAG: universal stress protein [Bifidobacterium psychraerophilum]|uniref:universal stress protein n=1 Tax=Bifidobacterium psychraerophilum TaxID=218140 RepID=UPI0039ED9438
MTQQQEADMGRNTAGIASDADIVVGVDGSEESFAALRWALEESVLTGQGVNAVFGWTKSWDLGAEPHDESDWRRVRAGITKVLDSWVNKTCADIPFDREKLTLTPVRASGPSALLQIGESAQQIVVGRRSLGRVARWFLGSTSSSLAEDADVPVTVVRIPEDDAEQVEYEIEAAFNVKGATAPEHRIPDRNASQRKRNESIVVGVDGSELSMKALDFAAREAAIHNADLHVLYCWQIKDLGPIPGYENAVPPLAVGQHSADAALDSILERSDIPETVELHAHAFHTSPAKGLINASQYASWVIVGSRGLSGLDAHFLGSVSKQLINLADSTVSIVR